MSNSELISKLEQAQALLADVYHYACKNGLRALEARMSVADSCVCDSLDELEQE